MTWKHFLATVAIVVVLGVVSIASADEAADLFASFFGERYKKVRATRDKADDIELAKELLAAAEKITDHQGLLTLFHEKAYALTCREPTGYALAIRAATTLAEKVPAKRADCRAKVLAVRRTQYLRGTAAQRREAAGALIMGYLADAARHEKDRNITAALAAVRKALGVAAATRSPARSEVLAEIKRLTARQRVAIRMKGFQTKLAANPADTDTRHKLIRMLVIEFDDPAAAVKVIEGATDEALRTYVPLAAGPIDKLAATVCAELGDWYWSQYPKADTAAAKLVCLGRAQRYIDRFLSMEKGKGIQALKAALTLKKVQGELGKLGQAAGDLAPLNLPHRLGPIKRIDLKVKTGRACFPPKGRLAVAGVDRGIIAWDLQTGRVLPEIGVPFSVNRLALSGDGKRVAAGSTDNRSASHFAIWDVATGQAVVKPQSKAFHLKAMGFMGNKLLMGGVDGEGRSCSVQNVTDGKVIARLPARDCAHLAWWSDLSKIIVVGGYDKGHATVYDAATGEIAMKYSSPAGFGYARRALLSADGKTLVVATSQAVIFDTAKSAALGVIGHPKTGDKRTDQEWRGYSAVAITPDGRKFIAAFEFKEAHLIIVYDLATRKTAARYQGHTDTIHGLSVSPDSRFLISAGDTTLRVWGLPK